MYYNIDKLLSRNALLSFVIGERGVGKSFSCKDYCINHYKNKKKRFVWLRRFGSDLDSAIGNNDNLEFFKDIKQLDKYQNKEFKISENKKIKFLYMNDILIGYGMSLKSAESLKGSDFSDVDTIIFDEFLVGDGGSHYLKNEPMYLLSLIETIGRLRPIRVICLGNATSVYNPYFEFFNIHLPYNSEFQTFKNGRIVVNYIKNEEYRKVKRESDFGELVKGTPYEAYAIDNQFVNDNNSFIGKKSPKAKLFFNICLNGKYFGIWADKNNMFVSSKCNTNNNVIMSFDYNEHSGKTILIKSRNVFMKNLVNHFSRGNLYFENQSIKHQIIELFKKGNLI